MKVTKAIIPAAGFGTRFLPIAKSVPKEMLPVLDKPVIQYVVEEAVAAGITDICFVVSRAKRPLEEYFHKLPELETELTEKKKLAELASVQSLNSLARVHFVWQQEMRGLGDAVLHGRAFVGNEPFAVLLGDCIVEGADAAPTLTKRLCETLVQTGASAVGLEEVPLEKVSRYGIAGGQWQQDDLLKVDRWIEKPSPEEAPTRMAVSARYVFTPKIFDLLATQTPGKAGEIQLTDAMARLLEHEPTFGVVNRGGRRYDIGNKLDFLKTNLLFGLRHPELGPAMKAWLRELNVADS
jgi:UTP--glucose-1-phosphate uridylyltransferase